MRPRPLLPRLLFLAIAAFAAALAVPASSAEYRWAPTGPPNWNAPGSWSPARIAPAATDRLVFDSGTIVSATNVSTQTIGQLVVSNSTQVTFFGNLALNTLTIAGDTGADLEITAGSSVLVAGANALVINLGTGATGSIAGDYRVTAAAHRLQALDVDAIVFAAGGRASAEVNFSGNLFGNGSGPSALNSVRFQAGSTYAQFAGANPFGAGQPSSVVTFAPGSKYQLNGTMAPATSGRTFANFEYNGPGLAVGAGSAACSIDSIVVNAGTLSLELTGPLSLRGSMRVRPGALLNIGPNTGTANYRLNGTATQALIDSSGNPSSNPGINFRRSVTVTLDNPAGIVSDGGTGIITIPGTLEFVQGIATLSLSQALTGTTSGASAATGWVNGRIVSYNMIPSAPTHTFPVGTATSYLPVDLTVNGMTDSISTGALVHSDVAFNPAYFFGSQLDTAQIVTQSWLIGILDTLAWSSFDAVMHFGPGDYGAGADPATFVARKQSYRVGPTTPADFQWRTAPTGVRTATSHQVVGVTRRIPSNTNFNFAVGEPTVVRVSALDGEKLEGVGTLDIRVVLSEGATEPVGVSYETVSGSAEEAVDFAPRSGTFSFAEGDTVRVVHVPTSPDSDPENHETFTVVLSNPFAGIVLDRDVATGTILDDDDVTPPSVTVLAPNGGESILEGASVDLEWLATDDVVVNAVDLYVSRDDGGTYEPIATGLANSGSFSWAATGPLTQLARFKAIAADHHLQLGEDASDAAWAITDATGVEPALPIAFALDLASANPSRGTCRIRYALPRDQHVRLAILDVRGRIVAALRNVDEAAGVHEVAWEGGDVPVGIYFVRIQTEEWTAQRKIARLP